MKKTYEFENLGCAHCAGKMEEKIGKLPDIESVNTITKNMNTTNIITIMMTTAIVAAVMMTMMNQLQLLQIVKEMVRQPYLLSRN